ncbi:MAG: hypothetical protein AB1798_15100 [Spirochaetota bacterium]
MNKSGRFGKYGDNKRKRNLQKLNSRPSVNASSFHGRDIIKFDKHIKISPKHPNMGKR